MADSGGMAGGDGGPGPGAGPGWRWDVALSFAGAQREYVGQVAAALKARGVRRFMTLMSRSGFGACTWPRSCPRFTPRSPRRRSCSSPPATRTGKRLSVFAESFDLDAAEAVCGFGDLEARRCSLITACGVS